MFLPKNGIKLKGCLHGVIIKEALALQTGLTKINIRGNNCPPRTDLFGLVTYDTTQPDVLWRTSFSKWQRAGNLKTHL